MKENYYTKEFIYTMKSIYIMIPFYKLNNQFSLSSVKNTFNFNFLLSSIALLPFRIVPLGEIIDAVGTAVTSSVLFKILELEVTFTLLDNTSPI